MHPARNHHLPLDPAAYRKAEHPRGRVIVIAPTRAACETIELALGTEIETLLQRKHGPMVWEWAASGKAFGIVAGTGTGKTLGIRPIAQAILQETLRYGVVNREREATPETPFWNVVIVTTGIARRWFQDDLISDRDTLIVDEIHQTSAELELCLALGKRTGCRFIWLSATVDPTFYAKYLNSAEILETSAFDPRLRAKVTVVAKDVKEFLDDRFVRHLIKERRGVAVFVPTRAEVERLAAELGDQWPKLSAAFYHGGEPIRVIRPFLEGAVPKPFLLAMTAAGQSALNIPGLDTVVIYDARYGNRVDRGRNVLHRLYLGSNEILQMAGRVHGRVPNGEVTILSDRQLDFEALRPTPPEFQLAGDAERVALTCAALGVDARDLDLPVPLDKVAYRRALELLTSRGLVARGRLTEYGREVEAMPVDRPWAELLVTADEAVIPIVAVCSNIDSLHRMTREERELHGALVQGSDHLTTYNLYAEAVNQHGTLGEAYGLPRHVFEEELAEWGQRRGVLVKAIEDAAMGTASVYRSLELPLPRTLPYANRELRQAFIELVAKVMPFDLVIDEHTADGQEVRVAKTSVAGSWGAVAGNVRYFADRFGVARASVEGTTISYELVRRNAALGPPEIVVSGTRRHQQLAVARRLEYFGFQLETDIEPLTGRIPDDLLGPAREALIDTLLAGETGHSDQNRIRRGATVLLEWWRRSGGALEAASEASLRGVLRTQLGGVRSWKEFLDTPLSLEPEALVPEGERRRLDALPAMMRLHGDAVPLDYEVIGETGVVRLRLREGQARRLAAHDLPPLDRPIRFAVIRAGEPPLRAESLEELVVLLKSSAVKAPAATPQERQPASRRTPAMTVTMPDRIPLEAIRQARERIKDSAIRTPLVKLPFDGPREIWLKLETLQPVGSFKIRGARNAIGTIEPDELAKGIYTASAGNMALGLAWCARSRNIPFTAIVPDHAPQAKLAALDRLGARIVPVPFERWWRVLLERTYEGMPGRFIHPVSDVAVMAGNATIGAEILEDLPNVEKVLVPYGGGGLTAGIASTLKYLGPGARVIACEVETAAPLSASLAAGSPQQIAYQPSFVDGIGAAGLLPEMWPMVKGLIAGVAVVSLEETADAIRTLVQRIRVVAEGAGAVAVATALSGKAGGGTICCIVSGGNIDPARLAAILTKAPESLGPAH